MKKALFVLVLATVFAVSTAGAQSVTRSTFRVITDVQELMEAERYQEAIAMLEELVIKTAQNPYDFALANQYLAHASVMVDNDARARTALEAALANPGLPDELRTDMNLFYGTVLLGDEEFELARKALDEWYSLAKLPLPNQVFSYAYAVYMTGDLADALPLIERAIGEASQPQNNWYVLYYRILFESKRYGEAEAVLHGMLTRDPTNKTYWRMMASHHLQLEESGKGLAAIMIGYINELIDEESDLKQIVSLYGYIDAPEKGARMLEQFLEEEKTERDADTLKQLGNMWLMARERDNALRILTEAASIAPDGRTFEMLGGVYFEEEEWDKAYDSYQEALRIGGLEEPERVNLLAGISAYRAGNNANARESLREAAKSAEFREQAESLLRQL